MKKPNSLPRLIESDAFPFEFLSVIGEQESWRKEVHRPIYHLHKWWAKRLGSTFRGILLSCLLPETSDFEREFFERHDFDGVKVLDPFMGSGTTVGEAHKLGFTVFGRDINPIACESVRVSLGRLDRALILREFARLEQGVGVRLRDLYRSEDRDGVPAEVLYYFWVKHVPCVHCAANVDLFSSYVFAKNAYVRRKPAVHVICAACDAVFASTYDDERVSCPECSVTFNPHAGPAGGATATCQKCSGSFKIVDAVKRLDHAPHHRLYAKLVLTSSGDKQYLRITEADRSRYEQSVARLSSEEQKGLIRLPTSSLSDGNNTRQAINYNYRTWRDFFNDRQLLALGWLQKEIAGIQDEATRDAFFTLFSGVLEFNNLFASYKGEGTGAVRHMFAHHILKPERTPIEANPWGTPKSSGAFSTLFRSRLLRAIDYRLSPGELGERAGSEVSSRPFSGTVHSWPTTGVTRSRGIYLSCGSSDALDLPDRSIDVIVTDPPFFDNVHYSELADFFNAWQVLYPHGFIAPGANTTRHPRDVQDADSDAFSKKLQSVFAECRRVLAEDGLLLFTYHHSRAEGWEAVAAAVAGAGFDVIKAHPVKSEMSVAMPKVQAKEPIQIDIVLVCRKQIEPTTSADVADIDIKLLMERTQSKEARLRTAGINTSASDRLVIAFSEFLCFLQGRSPAAAVALLRSYGPMLESASRRPMADESSTAAVPNATTEVEHATAPT
jgi:putative DNA methylase